MRVTHTVLLAAPIVIVILVFNALAPLAQHYLELTLILVPPTVIALQATPAFRTCARLVLACSATLVQPHLAMAVPRTHGVMLRLNAMVFTTASSNKPGSFTA